jgi:sugar/nucleoside kinase (ribokinase family)
MKRSIVIIGDALMDNLMFIDRLPGPGEDVKVNRYEKNTGGSAANTAAALAAFDLLVCLVSAVGDDEDGRTFVKNLESKGVDTSLIKRQGQTGFTVTLVDDGGERTMLSSRGASASVPELTERLQHKIRSADMLFISGYWMQTSQQAEFVIKAAQLCAGQIAFDPCPVVANADKTQLKELLQNVDIILPNETEYEYLKQEQDISGISCVAVKMGSRGARLLHEGSDYEQPAKQVEAVDTTGAGDAFNAGFLAAVIAGEEPQQWLAQGIKLAAEAVGRRGAV